jgi:hypothetical protein
MRQPMSALPPIATLITFSACRRGRPLGRRRKLIVPINPLARSYSETVKLGDQGVHRLGFVLGVRVLKIVG